MVSTDRRVRREQQVDDHCGQDQADLPDVPAGSREESVSAGMVPHPARPCRSTFRIPFVPTGRTMNPVNIAVNTSYPGAVKQVKQGPETRPETVEDRREELGYP